MVVFLLKKCLEMVKLGSMAGMAGHSRSLNVMLSSPPGVAAFSFDSCFHHMASAISHRLYPSSRARS